MHRKNTVSYFFRLFTWTVFILCSAVIVLGIFVSNPRPSLAEDHPAEVAQVDKGSENQAAVDKENEVKDVKTGDDAQKKTTADKSDGKDSSVILLRKSASSNTPFHERLLSFLGIFVLIGLAYLISNDRKNINWRTVAVGVLMQIIFAIFIFFVPYGNVAFDYVTRAFTKLLDFTNAGSTFIFSSYVTGKWEPQLINFAFATLPTIIFFSSLMTILYYLGVMQGVVRLFAVVMQKLLGASGAESLSVAANLFVGQTEAPLVVKPYIATMTLSELTCVMTGGFATVAGGVMAVYVGMLQSTFPDIAGHLLAATLMSAPAALVVSKIVQPETEQAETAGNVDIIADEKIDANLLDAASRGAAEGLKLALNVAAMLLAFTALIAMANYLIGLAQFWTDKPLTFQDFCSYLFWPIAWVMGVPTHDCLVVGRLLGVKMFINELVAYQDLAGILKSPEGATLSARSITIATYALCGFANFGSIGIQLGGIGGIAPNRKHDLAKVAFKAMLAGTIAALMTATVAGIIIP